jgi:nucleotide-binding universal stress UspA family protein
MRRIVVGLDATERDREVVHWVADFALDTGAQVIAAHFVSRASVWMIAGVQIDSAAYLDGLRAHFEEGVLRRLRTRIGRVQLHVAVGEPAHELAALAGRVDADLIAIGAPEHNAVHDVVFGSFERRLVHCAEVPVVTIPCGSRTLRPVP